VLIELAGAELIVDPGTGCYTADPDTRNDFRSARAHNALWTGNKPGQWKPGLGDLFMLRRAWRAKSRLMPDGSLKMRCSYKGSWHERRLKVGPDRIVVQDCTNRQGASLRWTFHPDTRIIQCKAGVCTVERNGHRVTIIADADMQPCRVPYSDHFKQICETSAVAYVLPGKTISTTLRREF
jgi:hypothetical protein